LFYSLFKYGLFRPLIRLLYRPRVVGAEHVPETGPAILVSNHISGGDPLVLPAMIKRRLAFPAKAELFVSRGVVMTVVSWFLRVVGMLPMDRSGGRASAGSMEEVFGVLRDGNLLGIYPEGTRSPDGRLYKGKTGVARLVLGSGVPVVPVGMQNTQFVRSAFFGVPTMRRPVVRFGPPLDFRAYARAGNDRDVLRYVTDEIMAAVQELTGQPYVDAYGASVKAALRAGEPMEVREVERPGLGRPVPPVPEPSA
jgi:1-acyl-sn-glycerol-3-phosphate acyltransferase